LEVISPITDTPAAKAGILPNDRIIEVGNVKIAEFENPEEAIDLIRGEPGSKVKIIVERTTAEGEIKILSFELVRDIIELLYIKEEILQENIGCIRITSFMDEHLVEKFQEKYDTLIKKGCKGLIIDLRNNPGGLLINALQIADLFIDKGIILETRGRLAINNKKTEAIAAGTYPKEIPIVILVNEGTASASEIVSGALHDHNRAVLVGKKTFGKGSVLELFPIPLSNGKKVGLAFTISKYFLPNGECIHKIGITPDFEVDLSEEVRKKVIGRSIYSQELRDYEDTQLNKAISVLKEKMPR
ncbi:MAG: S41 family peptidase, partial [Planctomycetota bacterium]